MLSLDQVDHFLQNHLKIPDWKVLLSQDKVEFLRRVNRNHGINIYFQGISIAAQEEAKRTNPSVDAIIKIGLDGTGGCCMHLNYFIHLVLKALDFETFVTAATWTNSLLVGSHCVTIVVLSENEKYLLDVGGGIPNYEIIPVHNLPFRTIAGGLPFEFRYSEKDNLYHRVQLKGRFYRGDFEPGRTEELKYTFNLEPNTFEDFDENMKILFTDPPRSVFFKNTFMFRHFEESGKLKFVHIWGTDVLEGDSTSSQVINYKSYNEMYSVIKKYFPKINDNELTSAIECFEAADAANYSYA